MYCIVLYCHEETRIGVNSITRSIKTYHAIMVRSYDIKTSIILNGGCRYRLESLLGTIVIRAFLSCITTQRFAIGSPSIDVCLAYLA